MVKFTLDITPRTSPRPRFSNGHAYMPPEYMQYKKTLNWQLKLQNIPKDEYNKIFIIAWFPYPKSTLKSKRIEGYPVNKKPDWDNIAKAITDCLEEIEVFSNDNVISDGRLIKLYTIQESGRFYIELDKVNPVHYINDYSNQLKSNEPKNLFL